MSRDRRREAEKLGARFIALPPTRGTTSPKVLGGRKSEIQAERDRMTDVVKRVEAGAAAARPRRSRRFEASVASPIKCACGSSGKSATSCCYGAGNMRFGEPVPGFKP